MKVRSTQQQLAKMKDEFVACRTLGHWWDDFVCADHQWANEHMLCVRCTSKRHRDIDAGGDVLSVYYDYAPGYSLVRCFQGDRLTAGELRLERMLRQRRAKRSVKKVRHLRSVAS